MSTMVMMTDVDLEHNGKYQHVAGSRSKALPQKVFNTLASLSTKDQNILCIRDARGGVKVKVCRVGRCKEKIHGAGRGEAGQKSA